MNPSDFRPDNPTEFPDLPKAKGPVFIPNPRKAAPPSSLNPRINAEDQTYRPAANQWLRMLIGLLRRLRCLRSCETDGLWQEEATVNNSGLTRIRRANTKAAQTVIENLGDNDAFIYENGNLVLRVRDHEQETLPQSGRLELHGQSVSATTLLRVTTYRRCDCGDAPGYGTADDDPVGVELL